MFYFNGYFILKGDSHFFYCTAVVLQQINYEPHKLNILFNQSIMQFLKYVKIKNDLLLLSVGHGQISNQARHD